MTITFGAWIIPVILSAACLFMLFRPYKMSGYYDFGGIFRLFWLAPIGFVWAAYFGIILVR